MVDLNAQFVIQQHTTPDGVHWDLMLENGGALWTWRLARSPEKITDSPVEAERIADHPLRFLTYEGPVQNAAGRVQISDRGGLRLDLSTPGAITCRLAGAILQGTYTLCQKDGCLWLFARCR